MTLDNILVLAATGKTGRRVVPRLRLNGFRVRPVSRASRIPFDWTAPRGWDKVLNGVDAIYLIAPPEVGLMADFVALAESMGVHHFVLLSGHRADQWGNSAFGRDMRDAENVMLASQSTWTIVRSSNFAQDFDEELWHDPLMGGMLTLPASETAAEPFIDIEDVADVIAAVFAAPGAHAGRVYELTGDRGWKFDDAVGLISRVSSLPMIYRRVTTPEYVDELTARGMAAEPAANVAAMFDLINMGVLAAIETGVQDVLHRPPRSFEDYVVRAASRGAWQRLQ